MILTVVVGATGTGKSHFTKEFIKKYPQRCIYDIQNEYNLKPFDARHNNKQFSVIDKKLFMNFTQKLRGYCFVLEECTAVLRGNVQTDFVQSVLSKRHTHNRFVLIFHAMHRIPPQIWEFTDYLILFKSNDLEKDIKKKYPEYFNDYKYLQNAPKYTKKIYKISNLAKDGIL